MGHEMKNLTSKQTVWLHCTRHCMRSLIDVQCIVTGMFMTVMMLRQKHAYA